LHNLFVPDEYIFLHYSSMSHVETTFSSSLRAQETRSKNFALILWCPTSRENFANFLSR
jgi:hypothetical protein